MVKRKTLIPPKDKRSRTSAINGAGGGRPPLPAFTDIGRALLKDLFYDSTRKTYTLTHWRGAWYTFDGTGWKDFPEGELRKIITTWLEASHEFGSRVRNDYVKNLLMHMAGFNLCGTSDIKDMPMWMDTDKSAKNWMCFSNR